jgi:hypothetical protein
MKIKSICAATVVTASLLAGCKADNAAAPVAVTPEPQDTATDAVNDTVLLPGSGVLTAIPTEAVSTPDSTNTCSLDAISGTAPPIVNAKPDQELTFSGWTSTKEITVPDKILIVLAGAQTYGVQGAAGVARNDVAQTLKAPALATSGFNVTTSLVGVAPGNYKISVLYASPQNLVACATSAEIKVSP